MLRKFAVNMISPLVMTAICVLAVPTFVVAQEQHPPGRPVPATRPAVVPHGPPPGKLRTARCTRCPWRTSRCA
jgi:hypothetical protein